MKIFGRLDKNSVEEIQFSFCEWNGKEYVDIRVWVKEDPEEGRKEIPTRKGIRFNAELLPDFLKILKRMDKKLAGESED
jgi:hypothetical protein